MFGFIYVLSIIFIDLCLALYVIITLFDSYNKCWDQEIWVFKVVLFFLIFIFFISWRLIILQYCSGFCHTLKWISHGFTCVPHPDPPSHLPLRPIPLGLPSAPGLSTCLMHPTWRQNTLRHKSQQDPLWPTSQNIRNKSKNKQLGPNET